METQVQQKVRFYLTLEEWHKILDAAKKANASSLLSRLMLASTVITAKGEYRQSISFEAKDQSLIETLEKVECTVSEWIVFWLRDPDKAARRRDMAEADRITEMQQTIADVKSAISESNT